MAEESPLEKAAKTAPEEEKKEEKKPQSLLESVINECTDAIKAGANLGIAAAAPAAGFALTGNLGVVATSAAYVAGTKGKKDSKTIRNESLSGAIFGTFAHYTLAPLKYLGNLGKIVYMGIWPFAANSFYMAEDHLIKEKSPKGLYKKFKEKFWDINKKAYKSVVPLNIAAALLLPQQFMVASIAVASYIFRRFVAGGEGKEHEDKRPYYVAASSAIGRGLSNLFWAPLRATEAIGSALKDLYSRAPKPEAKAKASYLPSPAYAPA